MSFSKRDLAISTMWNYRKANSGKELIDQLKALGFSRVELNYQVKKEWLSDIESYVQNGEIMISSVHNVFPKVNDERFGTDSVLLGYEDESLRKQAVEYACRSVDWAVRLGAGAVVFHPTEVPLSPNDFDVPLKKLIKAHKTDSDEYKLLQKEMLNKRKAEPFLQRTIKSIEEIADYVVKNGFSVRLGMENRAMCHQAPIYSEFDMIMEAFEGGPVGIWLDTGHGIMMEEMGLQKLPLSEIAERNIVGMHIHDAIDGLDHYAPCTLDGDVLKPFKKYIDACPIRVLELSGRLTQEEIIEGTERFVLRYGG
ncbi:MAG: TIM barrel protein [Clostridia bacterium]|nr:TIM barrel protein [Clostridia bacterium]